MRSNGGEKMDYTATPKYHYKPQKGWLNDPNGLVWFRGYYHIFYQHSPNYEIPWQEPMHWGHARTKDFLHWEEFPVALYPDKEYDNFGCWSGTAMVKDDILYLFYSSVYRPEGTEEKIQKVCVAYSTDGVHFTKYEHNPVIGGYPSDGSYNFRDPAVAKVDDKYYLVMASGHEESQEARLLLYESKNLLSWQYHGVMARWKGGDCAECPSFMQVAEKFLLTTSVCMRDKTHHFSAMFGTFADGVFTPEVIGETDKGPDQYAGQVFLDDKGRAILISWIPGWRYSGYAERDVGCMSIPRELIYRDGKVFGYPVAEMRHLLKKEDEALIRTENGFVIPRTNREDVVYHGKISSLEMIRDEYVLEVFINGGEEIYTALL